MGFRWTRPRDMDVISFIDRARTLVDVLKAPAGFGRKPPKQWAFQIEFTMVDNQLTAEEVAANAVAAALNQPPPHPLQHDNFHVQGWLKLVDKQIPAVLARNAFHAQFPGMHLFKAESDTIADYCRKADTRYYGYWDSAGTTPEIVAAQRAIIDRSVQLIANPRPFQKFILDSLKPDPDDRVINVLYDPVGGAGKSTFATALTDTDDTVFVLDHGHARHVGALVMSAPPKRTYIFDLSRSKPGEVAVTDIYNTIEQLKNGRVVQQFGTVAQRRQATAHIWVFTNFIPPFSAVSADRWRVYRIIDYLQFDIAPMSAAECTEFRRNTQIKELKDQLAAAEKDAEVDALKAKVKATRKAAAAAALAKLNDSPPVPDVAVDVKAPAPPPPPPPPAIAALFVPPPPVAHVLPVYAEAAAAAAVEAEPESDHDSNPRPRKRVRRARRLTPQKKKKSRYIDDEAGED